MNKQTLLIGAGAVAAGVVVIFLLTRFGKDAGRAIARGTLDLGAGAVIGVGESFGLPDTSDAAVRARGHAALARGDYLEASTHLPAGEFLSGLWARLQGAPPPAAVADPGVPVLDPYSINPRDRT